MKRIFLLGLVFMLVVLLVGRAIAAPKEVTIRYSTWDYADRTPSTDAWIADCQKKFGIKIELENVPTDQYENLTKTKVASGDAPDLINVHGVRSGYGMEIAKNGQFLDLSYLKNGVGKNFVAGAFEANTFEGKLYAIGTSTNVLGVIYNKGIFKNLKLNVPKNIDEFNAVCEKIKAAGLVPISGGFKDSWTTQLIPFIAIGQFLQGPDHDALPKLIDGKIKYTDPAVKKALAIQNDWAEKGYYPKNFLGSDINVASAMVGTGKAAMLINGTWQYKACQDADPKAQVGFFALPLNQKNEKTVISTVTAGCLCVNAKSKNLEAAKKALEYYLSPAIQTLVIKDVKGITTNTKVKVADPFLADVGKALASAGYVAGYWHGTYPGSVQSINTALEKGFQGMLAKETTVDKLTAELDEMVAEELAK